MMRGVRNFAVFVAIVAAMASLGVLIRNVSGADPGAGPAAEPEVAATGPMGPEVTSTVNASSGLRHPGVLVTVEQLELVRAKIRSREQPWSEAFRVMVRGQFADLAWRPGAREVVEC